MARYLDIQAIEEPHDNGLDVKGRARVTFDIAVVKTASETFAEEIIKILTDAGVDALGDLLASSRAAHPEDETLTFLTVIEDSGASPDRIQNQAAPAYQRPIAQITAFSKSYTTARAMARAAYNALTVVRNQTVTP